MPFTGSTFGLWNDANCTSAFSGTLSAVHYTDLSDNPQDFVLYLGSPTTDRVLQASSNPGVDDITLTPTDITEEWQDLHAYTLGTLVKPTTPNGFVYKCVSAGTSAASEPTWPVVGLGSTVSDGSCLWSLYAVHHPITEIKLALSSGALGAATGGAALAVATSVDSGAANSVAIHIRLTNTVTTVSNNTGNPEIGIYINGIIELGVV
jgi:hypothetical protein